MHPWYLARTYLVGVVWCTGHELELGAPAEPTAGGDGEVPPGSARALQELPGPDSWALTFEGQVCIRHVYAAWAVYHDVSSA